MTNITNFAEARRALQPFVSPTPITKNAYSLNGMKKLLEQLGNPQEKLRVVHVAGTSGKTSTSYYIAAMLGQAGKKVGLTVSPHLDEVNERLQINLRPLPEAEYCAVLSEFLELIKKLGAKPSYFELLIALAYWYFAQEQVDYAVVEVGLGGLLDGTNVVTRPDKVCVITDIGIDHAQILGNTVAEIAAQKAGIIQPGNVVFSYEQSSEIMEVIRAVCKDKEAILYAQPYDAERGKDVPLPAFQRRNWQLAARAFEYVARRDGFPSLGFEAWQATQQTYIPGRMETIRIGAKTLILDGAHNPQKMQAFADSLRERYAGQKIAALVSFKEDKDRAETLLNLQGLVDTIIITEYVATQDMQHHSAPAAELSLLAQELGFEVQTQKDKQRALEQLLARPEQILIITGSFYLLDQVRPSIKGLRD